jgi:hypothetical protein
MLSNRKIFFGLISVLSTIVICATVIYVSSQQSHAAKIMYTGNENHQISYAAGKEMIERFLNTRVDNGLIAGYMGRNIFEKILAQEKCVGIRIYQAKLGDGASTFVIIGVDGNGKDMERGVVGEEIFSCPPWCNSEDIASVNAIPQSKTAKE